MKRHSLDGKIIFITGATSGFGDAFAHGFHAAGAKIIAVGRRAERLDALKKKLGDRIHALALDVRDAKAVSEAALGLPADFRDVDVLINNAGLALGLGKAPDVRPEEWNTMIDTNIKGVLHCTHALLPGMIARGGGHIVNIGSVAGNYPYPGGNVYGASKAFVRQFSLNLRADLLGKNIRVTNIEPGMVETEFSLVRLHGDSGKAKAIYEGIEALHAEDIADAVLYCCSAPTHVNINTLEIMPVNQSFAGFSFERNAD